MYTPRNKTVLPTPTPKLAFPLYLFLPCPSTQPFGQNFLSFPFLSFPSGCPRQVETIGER